MKVIIQFSSSRPLLGAPCPQLGWTESPPMNLPMSKWHLIQAAHDLQQSSLSLLRKKQLAAEWRGCIIYIYIYTYMYVCMYVWMYVCMYVYIYITWIHELLYIYIYKCIYNSILPYIAKGAPARRTPKIPERVLAEATAGGTPNSWMVYSARENPSRNGWWFRGTPIYGNPHVYNIRSSYLLCVTYIDKQD